MKVLQILLWSAMHSRLSLALPPGTLSRENVKYMSNVSCRSRREIFSSEVFSTHEGEWFTREYESPTT